MGLLAKMYFFFQNKKNRMLRNEWMCKIFCEVLAFGTI